VVLRAAEKLGAADLGGSFFSGKFFSTMAAADPIEKLISEMIGDAPWLFFSQQWPRIIRRVRALLTSNWAAASTCQDPFGSADHGLDEALAPFCSGFVQHGHIPRSVISTF
jgi:hypothetical protein